MIKKSYLTHTLGVILFSVFFLFTACDNLLNGGLFKDQLEDSIRYASAEAIDVTLQPEGLSGTSIPTGLYSAKLGYAFDIKFTENSDYCFIEWKALTEDGEAIPEDKVTFTDSKAFSTQVKISSKLKGIRIVPVCEKRIAINGEPTPKYAPNGVSRDRSITVQFTKNLSKASFIFTEDEVPSTAEKITNSDGEIWAYKLNELTYLKNISITNSDDISMAEHFLQPVVDGNLLIVAVNKEKQIEIDTGAVSKTIKVTLGKNIQDENGIAMNAETTWRYIVTEETDEKATISVSADKGIVSPNNTKDYSLGQSILLSYTEDPDYQFIRWDYDSNVIKLTNNTDKSTTALVVGQTSQGKIKAICAERLRVQDFAPVTNAANPTVSKNSSITITFNKKLPVDEESLKQLENITITMGGASIKSSFMNPEINENTVTFAADKNNFLEVAENQTKVISVTIPSDMYYTQDDGTKVYYGGNGKTFDYKIDYTTLNKAEVTFIATENSGTVSPSGSNNKYSIGQKIPLSFTVKDGFIFNEWKVTSGNADVDESKIRILDKTNPNTKMIIYDAIAAVTVKAECSEKLTVALEGLSGAVNPKDSLIKLKFNKNLYSSCGNLLDKIKVSINGNSVDSNFESRFLYDDTITLVNTSLLDVTGQEEKIVSVTVPAIFFYKSDNKDVYLAEETAFTYRVNSTTNAKAEIEFSCPSDSGTITPNGSKLYSIGEVINLSFEPKNDYNFTGWNILDENNNPVSENVLSVEKSGDYSATIKILKKINVVKITPKTRKLPRVVDYEPKYNNNGKEFLTPITITFNTPLKKEDFNESFDMVEIEDSYKRDLSDYYNYPELSEDGKTLAIKPKFEYTLKQVIPVDGKLDISVTLSPDLTDANGYLFDNPFNFMYRVNDDTETDPPVFEKIVMAASEEDLDNIEKQFDNNIMNSYSPSGNRVKNKVWLYIEVSDEATDVKYLDISDELVKDSNNNTLEPAIIGNYAYYDIQKLTPIGEHKHRYIKIPYTIGNYEKDGLVKITVTISDYSDVTATQELGVIRSTSLDALNFKLLSYYLTSTAKDENGKEYPPQEVLSYYDNTQRFTREDLLNYKPNIAFTPGNLECYKNYNVSGSDFKWTLYYTQTEGQWSEDNSIKIQVRDDDGNPRNNIRIDMPEILDKTKRTFLRFKVEDEIGNESYFYREYSSVVNDVFAVIKDTGSTPSNGKGYKIFEVGIKYPTELLPEKVWFNYIIYYKDLTSSEDYFKVLTNRGVAHYVNGEHYGIVFPYETAEEIAFFNNCDNYEFYIQSVYYILNDNAWGNLLGPISDLKYARKAITAETPLVINDSWVKITPVPNSEKQHVKITIPAATANKYSNIYLSKLVANGNNNLFYQYDSVTSSIEFDVDTSRFFNQCTRQDVSFEIKYGNGNVTTYVYSKDKTITDNVKPKLTYADEGDKTHFSTFYNGDYIQITVPVITVDGVQILSEVGYGFDDEFTFDCYYKEWDESLNNVTEEYVRDNFIKRVAKAYKKEPALFIPMDHLVDGDYMVYIEYSDKAGNSNFIKIGKCTRNKKLSSTTTWSVIPGTNDKLQFRITSDYDKYPSDACTSVHLETFVGDENDFTWEPNYIRQISNNWYWDKDSSNRTKTTKLNIYYGAVFNFNYTFSGTNAYNIKKARDYPDTYLRFYLSENQRIHRGPFYIYSKYGKWASNKCDDQNYFNPVEVADILDKISEVEIYCSDPVFVHVLYNKENFGDNIEQWEAHASKEQELDVKIIRPSVGNEYKETPYIYPIPRVKIPSGNYYCAIVHFADGTAKMTQVLYK